MNAPTTVSQGIPANAGRVSPWLTRLAVWSLASCLAQAQFATTQPTIRSVSLEDSNVAVVVDVPDGVVKVALEGRPRLANGAWTPRAVVRLSGMATQIVFRLPGGSEAELLRATACDGEPLPASFYQGTNEFGGQKVEGAGPGDASWSASVAGGGYRDATPVNFSTPVDSLLPTRDVEESDIWKLDGDTLYFFNQYRGLQIIDVGEPDSPTLVGSFELPAAGEDLYLLRGGFVALLARDGCGWTGSGDQSQVLIVDTSPEPPARVAALTIPGYIQESRLVGTALYVASQTYRPVDSSVGSAWEYGVLISPFDLADPSHPQPRGTSWFPGYGNAVMATDRYLFVAAQSPTDYWHSVVRVLDISAPDGTTHSLYAINVAGRVQDKFKMNLNGDVFTAITEAHDASGVGGIVTMLETFSLAGANAPAPLGRLELGQGERLHATRFDGTRAYVVTFFQIDPLWVVDLSDPAQPSVAGSVDVPGWSTYIEPLDSRLVTVGVESGRVAVSLFDVGNPASPALLSKARLGEGYSWSEANGDEKVFKVLPNESLILVPFSAWQTNAYRNALQLIDLGPTNLVLRGVVERDVPPRRALAHREHLLSVSGRELFVCDIADRDSPIVAGSLDLAWPVDRVFAVGDYLLEISQGDLWNGGTRAVLRVVAADRTDAVASSLTLGELPFLGASVQGDSLYVAQGVSPQTVWQPVVDSDGVTSNVPVREAGTLTLDVIDLRALPDIVVRGSVATHPSAASFWSLEALWPSPNLLVWSGQGDWYCNRWGGPLLATDMLWGPWYWGGSSALLAFDVSAPAEPRLASDLDLAGDGQRWNFSRAFAADGLVYVSHQTAHPWWIATDAAATTDPAAGVTSPAIWRTQYFLDAVDYADPTFPTIRDPINIPGTLQGVARGGSLIYTSGQHWDTNGVDIGSTWLDASAYDGVSVHLIDSLALPGWGYTLAVQGETVFIAAGKDASSAGFIEAWGLSEQGRFELLSRTDVPSVPWRIVPARPWLLAQDVAALRVYDATDPSFLRLAGENVPPGCIWYDASRSEAGMNGPVWVPLNAYGLMRVDLKAP
jgi:hypothetical protein